LLGPIIQSLNHLIATSRFTSSIRARWRIAARDILHNAGTAVARNYFFVFA
jgi:hypothetical protein